MTLSIPAQLKGFHQTAKAIGAKAVSSDFALEIEGHEDSWMLIKQGPWAMLSTGGEIEVPMPLGAGMWQQQQAKVHQQSPVSLMETTVGSVDQLLVNLIASGGYFNAKIYEGTPQKYLRAKPIIDCFIQVDNPDRDWENRSQLLLVSGTIFFHYYGETIPGNSNDYR
ncbi:MAG: hypothetical protein M0Q44_01430 [Methylobacter sp.]|jgi:hypothetical protein|nr:hypothetical protein [Methylobacter sp.]